MSVVVLRVAKEFDVVKFSVTKAGQQRVDRLTNQKKCVSCEEAFNETDVLEHACGQCKTCYNAAQRAIREGRVTKEQLIRDGLSLPPQSGRSAKNKFTQSVGRKSS